jgi:hypothetical protein
MVKFNPVKGTEEGIRRAPEHLKRTKTTPGAGRVAQGVECLPSVQTPVPSKKKEIPRWRLEGGSRKRASYSEILERHWRHTLQAKPLRRGKTLTPLYLQPVQRISTSF